MSPPHSNPSAISASAPPCVVTSETADQSSLDHWFASEVKPHEPALRAFLHRKYPSLSDVDDVVQESFLKTFLAWQKGRLTSAKGFLFTAASNVTISLFRKRKFIDGTAVNEMAELRVLEDDADVRKSACTSDELALISEAIVLLPERCRQVVVLRVLRGFEYHEIAAELQMSEATVRVQLARGIKKCTEFLREKGVVPPSQP